MMAVLLMDIRPNLNHVHMVWSPVDEYSILCLPPVLSMVHPSGPSMAAITRVDLCSHSNNVCGNSKSFPAIMLLRLDEPYYHPHHHRQIHCPCTQLAG
jgi:hypothetical protein